MEDARREARRRGFGTYVPVLLASVFLLTACRSGGWAFRNSSRYYRDPNGLMSSGLQTYNQSGLEGTAVILLWPVVFDTLALPVTLTHDFFFMEDEEEDAVPDGDEN